MKLLFSLSINNIKKYKRETILIILSIALSISMMVALASIIYSSYQLNLQTTAEYNPFNASISLHDVNRFINEFEDEEIIYYDIHGGPIHLQDDDAGYSGFAFFKDSSILSNYISVDFKLSEGRYPKNSKELVITHDSKLKVGDYTFMTTSMTEVEEEVELLIVGRSVKNMSHLGLDLEVDEMYPSYNLRIIFNNNIKDIDHRITQILETNDYSDNEIQTLKLNSDYNYMLGMQSSPGKDLLVTIILIIAAIVLVSIVTSSLIINSFNSLLSQKENTLKTLRTVGTTKTQMMIINFIEASVLSIIGIVLGSTFGVYLAKTLMNLITSSINSIQTAILNLDEIETLLEIVVSFPIIFLIGIFNFLLIILLLMFKVRNTYKQSITLNDKLSNKKFQQKTISNNKPIISLAKINRIYKNSYKGIRVTLFLVISLLVLANTLTSSASKAINQNLKKYDSTITGDFYSNQDEFHEIDIIFDIFEEYQNINSTRLLYTHAFLPVDTSKVELIEQELRYQDDAPIVSVKVFDQESFNTILKENDLSLDTKVILNNVFTSFDNNYYQSYDINDGDKLYFIDSENNEELTQSITIGKVINDGSLILDEDNEYENDEIMLMSIETYEKNYSDLFTCNVYKISLDTDFGQNDISRISKQISEIESDTYITFNSDYIAISVSKIVSDLVSTISIFIFAYIGLVVIISIINTSLGNIRNRRKEIAILMSVGASQKQIQKLLFYEGIKTLIMTSFTSLILANIISIILIKFINSISEYKLLSYSFSVPITLITIGFLLLILIIQYIIIKYESENISIIDNITGY